MKCDYCEREFLETPNVLAEITWHILISHDAKTINGEDLIYDGFALNA